MRKSIESTIILVLWLTFAVVAGVIVYKQTEYLNKVAFGASSYIFLSKIYSLATKTKHIDYISCKLRIPENLINSKIIINCTSFKVIKGKNIIKIKINKLNVISHSYILNSTKIIVKVYRNRNGEIEIKITECYDS